MALAIIASRELGPDTTVCCSSLPRIAACASMTGDIVRFTLLSLPCAKALDTATTRLRWKGLVKDHSFLQLFGACASCKVPGNKGPGLSGYFTC